MSSSNEEIYGLQSQQAIVPAGATNALLIENVGRQTSILIKYFSGNTLILFGTVNGSTMAGPSLVAGYSNGYIMSTTEAIQLDGPVRFYLCAQGATGTAMILKGLTNPGFNGTQGE